MNPHAIASAAAMLLLGLSLSTSAQPGNAGDTAEARDRVQRSAAALAAELSSVCPLMSAGDKAAYDNCRKGLFKEGSVLRAKLPKFVFWGRQRDPKLSLKETSLTQFAPDTFANMYLPLFMFNGKHTVRYIESEGLYQVRLQTAFRNRLEPGQFPYPFWHDSEKWTTYENAREVVLYWDGKADRIRVAQFTVHSELPALQSVESVQHAKHDGGWMWTDAQGRTQPKVTVFDGLFDSQNPHIGQVDQTYKALALRLRESQCNSCHVPNNPDKMKRLVLLQTPAHAAGEVGRLIKSVREDKMPIDKIGVEQPLEAQAKADLLKDAESFERAYLAAKAWEKSAAR
ncbi:MAG: hypothetical protein RLZZ618_4078 [Pseudomonadota bacterium]|jgi:hypothetical protein